MKPYLVKQGDHLAKMAFCLGIDPDETWNHPRNAELRAQREPNVLAPGDILHVPISRRQGLPFTQGATNRHRGAIPRAPLRIVFQAAGKAIANEPFEADDWNNLSVLPWVTESTPHATIAFRGILLKRGIDGNPWGVAPSM